MNPNHRTGTSDDEAAFDHAVRAVHARALEQVSTPTLARLRSSRTAAASTGSRHAPRHGLGWALAGGLVAVSALAIGLHWRAGPGVEQPTAVAAATDSAESAGDLLATLDENPDFYLWLASADAPPAAQEL